MSSALEGLLIGESHVIRGINKYTRSKQSIRPRDIRRNVSIEHIDVGDKWMLRLYVSDNFSVLVTVSSIYPSPRSLWPFLFASPASHSLLVLDGPIDILTSIKL